MVQGVLDELFLGALVHEFEAARNFALSVVGVQDVCLGCLGQRLLKLGQGFFYFVGFAFLDQVGQRAGQMLHVGLQTKIFRRTLVVLAEIFDGGLLDWHRKMSRRIPNIGPIVNIWYACERVYAEEVRLVCADDERQPIFTLCDTSREWYLLRLRREKS